MTNAEYVSSAKNNNVPNKSCGFPKRFCGVAVMIFSESAVSEPSSVSNRFRFCSVIKNPGAMALTRKPASAKCTAIHCVKLLIAAFAALYAGTFVIGA
ncbi:hypothetical protein D9M71_825590 [compost metagenome]